MRRIWFFAGGDYLPDRINVFTGRMINYLSELLGAEFSVVQDIYSKWPVLNVLWGLNHAQRACHPPGHSGIIQIAYKQIKESIQSEDTEIALITSSYGSVTGCQTAWYLAHQIELGEIKCAPFMLAIGAAMVSKESELYKDLEKFKKKGIIKELMYNELQDDGDNAVGVGETSRSKAYLHALGIYFPSLTRKYSGPAFSNKNPVTGHLHRVRALSIEKAYDFLRAIFINANWFGEDRAHAAAQLIERINNM